jgi:DNA-binding transcriptional MerR regulator
MRSLSIGQVARRSGVSIEGVRFYEREGLLEEPPRRASGYRQYSEEAIKRIRLVKRTQQLGYSLKEVTDLLTPRREGRPPEQIKKRTEAKLAERKMVELERIRRALKH